MTYRRITSFLRAFRSHTIDISRKANTAFFQIHVGLFGWRFTKATVEFLDKIGLGFICHFGWMQVLSTANRRIGLVDYTRKRLNNKPNHPRRVTDYIGALIEARNFPAAREAIDTLAPRVYVTVRSARTIGLILAAYRTIVDVELSKDSGVIFSATVGDSAIVAGHFYARVWEMHGMLNAAAVRKYARLHLISCNYEPSSTQYVCERLLIPNGLYPEIEEACRNTLSIWSNERADIVDKPLRQFFRTSKVLDYLAVRKGLSSRMLLTSRMLTKIRLLLMDALYNQNKPLDDLTIASIGLKEARFALAVFDARRDVIEKRYEDGLAKFELLVAKSRAGVDGEEIAEELVQELYLQMGMASESLRRFDAARMAYQRATEFNSKQEWHGESNWRYAAMLLFLGEWGEAQWIRRRQLASYWHGMRRVSRHNIHKRIRGFNLMIPGDTLVMGGRGLGDEIFRLMMLRSIRNPGAHYYYTVDPRLVDVFGPGNDWLTPVPVSRTSGPFAVSEARFWADREGVPKSYDVNRATVEVLTLRNKLKRNVMMSEDLFAQSILLGPDFEASGAPLFHVHDEELARVGRWLSSLPGKLKVGISWRSGSRDFMRDLGYKDILECGALLGLKGVDFINLQYSDTSEECAEVRKRFGAEIHTMPGIDLKDDLRDICALALACDVVIAPSTTVRELAGAAGANVWSLTIVPYVPDLWRRKSNSNIDRFYPTMRHYCVIDYGDSDRVIEAMATEIATMLKTAPETWTMRDLRQLTSSRT